MALLIYLCIIYGYFLTTMAELWQRLQNLKYLLSGPIVTMPTLYPLFLSITFRLIFHFPPKDLYNPVSHFLWPA